MVKKFLKYSAVGLLGTAIDFSTLIIQVEFLRINIYIAVLISFLLAASSNHFFNRRFTFKSMNSQIKKEYLKFILVSSVGILINILIIYFLSQIFHIYYLISKIIATSLVLLWNFLMNYHWTFKSKPKHE